MEKTRSKMIKKIIVISGLSLLLAMQHVSASIPKENSHLELEEMMNIDEFASISENYSDIAFDCYMNGEYEQGIENIKKSIELEPSNYNHSVLGMLYLAKEDLNNALDSFIAAHYYDYPDKKTVRNMLWLKKLIGLDDKEFRKRRDLKFIELDYENSIFLQYDKFNDIFK